MTHTEFWEHYDKRDISMTLWYYENQQADNGDLAMGEIISFSHGGKYYFRVCKNFAPKGYRRRYKNGGWSQAFFMVFDNKESANTYFIEHYNNYTKIGNPHTFYTNKECHNLLNK